MKTKLSIAVLFLGLAAVAHATPPKTPLALVMDQMASDYKKLSTVLDGSNETLATVRDFKTQVAQARTLIPAEVVGQPDEASAYQAKMDELSAELDKLETALSQGDLNAAKVSLARVKQIKGEGHQRFNNG